MPIWFYIQRYLPIILGGAIFIGLLIGVQRQARKKGLEIDFLSPSGDPTRHILASLVLRGALFRNTILRQLRNPFLARAAEPDRKSTRLNSSHPSKSRMPSSA